MTRAQCSVEIEGRGNSTRKVGGRKKVTVDARTQLRRMAAAEPRVPIGKKFVHKRSSETSSSAHRSSSPIEQWICSIAELGVRGIRKEFVHEVKGFVPLGAQSAWEDDKNFEKNRYEDIRLLDKTRVIIKKSPDNDDYIHASYVQVDNDVTYICAQGPLPNTVQNFWIMIIQEQSKVVLQLCQSIENGKEQSAEYFPTDAKSKGYGAVNVKILEKPSNVIGLKKVTRTKIQATYGSVTHEVIHILYWGWPDHCVAESPAVCKEVRNIVHRHYERKPIVVHCSAGIGRTGTFVAMEMAISRLKRKEAISICDLAKALREQRMGAIQNDQQYLFIFRMVIEILMSDDLLTKDLQVMNFLKEYDDVIQRKRLERKKRSTKA
uniref:Protein-tyrosine-phosphatase n=1 Tax=Ascaris lumbricoides TaxID=6252 RepID=A0A9J2PW32_ASCLU